MQKQLHFYRLHTYLPFFPNLTVENKNILPQARTLWFHFNTSTHQNIDEFSDITIIEDTLPR